jgi:hypothetical protein
MKTKNKSSINSKSWTWYKALTISLLHPNDSTGKALITDGNISFKQAYIWIVVASIIFQLLDSALLWIKIPSLNYINSIIYLVKTCFLAGVFSPLTFIVLTGFMHILAKLFGSRGTFQNFFIIYIAFSAPILFIFSITILLWQVFAIKLFLVFGVLSSFYYLIIVTTKTVKANYHFHWFGALLISVFVQVVTFITTMSIIIAINPNIIKR